MVEREIVLLRQRHGTVTGTSRYAVSLHRALGALGIRTRPMLAGPESTQRNPLNLGRFAGVDLPTFLTQYPVLVAPREADLWHLTSQNLATLLAFKRLRGRSVVTVHDIIPHWILVRCGRSVYRHGVQRWFDRLAVRGLQRADLVIADSHWTAHTLRRAVELPRERIRVVPLGVEHAVFRPQPVPAAFCTRYGLRDDEQYLLYVGSEDPRKNVALLLRLLAHLKETMPRVRLLKVGPAHHLAQRQELLQLADQLGVGDRIRWIDWAPEEDLPLFYNVADVCVMPSNFEGFGLPVLEAMACGTAVVCARAASLPEVAGDAALVVAPGEAAAWAEALRNLLADGTFRAELSARGLERARAFTWERTARETAAVYREALNLRS